jgi:hypothetical protein
MDSVRTSFESLNILQASVLKYAISDLHSPYIYIISVVLRLTFFIRLIKIPSRSWT